MLQRLFCLLMGCVLATAAWAQPFPTYGEPYRPGFHFSPQENWTNEPNGLIYHDGRYHMFYQANPFTNQFGNQSWGHATSPDLVNWTQQPVAIPADDGIFSYSGSAVYDANNTSGLGIGDDGPLVAVYTGFIASTGIQDQRLAFSNDSGTTWTKFSGNPVLDIGSNEIRDPKVFWHEPTEMWKMAITRGGQKKVDFYQSPNLQDWSFQSSFTGAGIPSSIGGWEVPDMFELPVDGDPNNTKWVLSITPSAGSPAGGNGVLYFVGDYDGAQFTNDNAPTELLWADYGRDFDGQQSWSNMPDGRRVWTSIAQSYGESVPTTPWRGQMSFPREVTLRTGLDGEVRINQTPIHEIQSLRIPGAETILSDVAIGPTTDPLAGLDLQHDMFELIATIEPQLAQSILFDVREGANGQRTRLGWLQSAEEMFVDRRGSGNITFHPGAGGFHRAPLELENGKVKLHALVDRNSVELFGNDGRSVISDLIFPDPSHQGISISTTGGDALLESLEIYPLRSIWTEIPAEPGSNVVARWSMDRTPHGTAGNAFNPVTVDSRSAFGEGTRLGTVNQTVEPNPAVENLYMFNQSNLPMQVATDVPPTTMFAYGKDGGAVSYDAGSQAGRAGALFLPADIYGDELAFQDAFSIELFFKTSGDRSDDGLMQLLNQGEDRFRFGLIVNEGGDGNVRFALNDDAGTIPLADMNSITNQNYADGEWHYLLATYDPEAGDFGSISMTIANEDGSHDTVTTALTAAFDGLPSGGDGNLLIGRNQFNVGNERTFLGLIDEIQFTNGLVSGFNRLGAVLINRLGDFDDSGSYDCADIDSLVAAVAAGSQNIQFDLTGDGDVDELDVTAWLVEAGAAELGSMAPFLTGDANLDGVVDISDFNIWNANKFTASPAWCSGDFNVDGVVDISDFNIWNSNKFQTADQPHTVPEPSTLSILFLLGALAAIRPRVLTSEEKRRLGV